VLEGLSGHTDVLEEQRFVTLLISSVTNRYHTVQAGGELLQTKKSLSTAVSITTGALQPKKKKKHEKEKEAPSRRSC
jgi:hypothetical protein